jgi:MFS family permease
MSQQRLFILLAAITGMVSVFLPWQVLPLSDEMSNGLHGYGIIVFACFCIMALLAVAGNRRGRLGRLLRIVCLLTGILSATLMLVYLSGFSDVESREDLSFAPFLTTIASIGALAAAFFYPPSDVRPPEA